MKEINGKVLRKFGLIKDNHFLTFAPVKSESNV
jgi:hypothetical protein